MLIKIYHFNSAYAGIIQVYLAENNHFDYFNNVEFYPMYITLKRVV